MVMNQHLYNIIFRHIQYPNMLCLLGTIQRESSLIIVTNFVQGMDLQTMIFDSNVERV